MLRGAAQIMAPPRLETGPHTGRNTTKSRTHTHTHTHTDTDTDSRTDTHTRTRTRMTATIERKNATRDDE
ncbi:hypothetical protein [Cryobacterium sp. TMT2-14]|uniref:hypothetical protein n=1 Tax=Cryobacterium sp. TMT2-14 TaxID=1259245 RepID=UPI00141BA644|nr:hypothetical protein [Cryobacterium sp. TMT2-14]